MSRSMGLVGLPNVGKSTLFNALTRGSVAEIGNYEFTTINPSRVTVAVPAEKVDLLRSVVGSKKAVYDTVQVVDVAGLVKGAAEGRGMGNQFLSDLKGAQILLHVQKGFGISGKEIVGNESVITDELIVHDLQMVEARKKKVKMNHSHLDNVMDCLGKGIPARYVMESVEECGLKHDLLTSRDVVNVVNVEDELYGGGGGDIVKVLKEHVFSQHRVWTKYGGSMIPPSVIPVSARLEYEMMNATPKERAEMLDILGLSDSEMQDDALTKILGVARERLGLRAFYTVGKEETRAWYTREQQAGLACGVIHSDFTRGFVRARVVGYDECLRQLQGKKELGDDVWKVLQFETVGKGHLLKEDDVVYFEINQRAV